MASVAGPSGRVNGGRGKQPGCLECAADTGTQPWPREGAIRAPILWGQARGQRPGGGLRTMLPAFSLRGLTGQSWSPSTCLVLLVLIFSVDSYRRISPSGLCRRYCRIPWELMKTDTRPGPTLLTQLRWVRGWAWLFVFPECSQRDSNGLPGLTPPKPGGLLQSPSHLQQQDPVRGASVLWSGGTVVSS